MTQLSPHLTNVLGALPEDLASGLFSKGPVMSVKADQTLFMEGDEADGCYRVKEGLLKASISAPDGGERILAILGPGDIIGELAMIDGGLRSASITALRDSQLNFVSKRTFDTFAQERPELCHQLARLLTQRLRDTNNSLTTTNFLSVKGRVASALLQLAKAFGRDVGSGRILIWQKVTHSDIAAMAGVARENVSRLLSEWTDRSWLTRLGGYYCFNNKKAIEREVEI